MFKKRSSIIALICREQRGFQRGLLTRPHNEGRVKFMIDFSLLLDPLLRIDQYTFVLVKEF